MNKLEIYRKITEIVDAKKKHLIEYKKNIDSIAENEESMMFIQGICSECDDYDKAIVELESKLNK